MTLVLAISLTAIVAATAAALLARRFVLRSTTRAIGGRVGADPVAEHERLLSAAEAGRSDAEQQSALLVRALDALTSGVVVTDRSGHVLVRNRLAGGVSGRAHEQALVDAAISELIGDAARGLPGEREVEIFGPPARMFFVHAVPIADAGETVGALALIDDVSDHHRIEKTRRDFVANLSHELRTPVGAISLLSEMVAAEDDAITRAQLTDRLLAETERMTHTINDLLELSRIESDAGARSEPVDVGRLIHDAVARCQVAAEARGVSIGALAPTEPIEIIGNADQLLTALVNLVENAVKYSDRGATVGVRARVGKDKLRLVVQDTGRGIPARDLDRIFERFYRVDQSRDSATGGSGIGLSIVRHVALNHGGRVAVESFEGEGSTFTIELPMASPSLQAQPAVRNA